MKEKIGAIELSIDENNQLVRSIFTLGDKIEKILYNICILIGVLLTVIVLYQVITRYAIGRSPLWTNELAIYLAMWMCLIVASILIRDDENLQIEMVYNNLDLSMKYYIRLAQLGLIFVFGVNFMYQGIQYSTEQGFYSTSPALGMDMFWAYLILPITGALITFFSFEKLLEIVADPHTIEKDYEAKFNPVEGDG